MKDNANNSIEVICGDDGMHISESKALKAKRLALAAEKKLHREKLRAKAKATREAKKLIADKEKQERDIALAEKQLLSTKELT